LPARSGANLDEYLLDDLISSSRFSDASPYLLLSDRNALTDLRWVLISLKGFFSILWQESQKVPMAIKKKRLLYTEVMTTLFVDGIVKSDFLYVFFQFVPR